MPKGVTKQVFQNIKKYYEPDVFRAAGKRIRSMARAADSLNIEERIARIINIFSTFRNPDKRNSFNPLACGKYAHWRLLGWLRFF